MLSEFPQLLSRFILFDQMHITYFWNEWVSEWVWFYFRSSYSGPGIRTRNQQQWYRGMRTQKPAIWELWGKLCPIFLKEPLELWISSVGHNSLRNGKIWNCQSSTKLEGLCQLLNRILTNMNIKLNSPACTHLGSNSPCPSHLYLWQWYICKTTHINL